MGIPPGQVSGEVREHTSWISLPGGQHVGIGRIPTFIVGPDLAAGRLTRILPDYTMPSQDVYAIWPERRHLPAKVRLFVDFLCQRIGDANPNWDTE